MEAGSSKKQYKGGYKNDKVFSGNYCRQFEVRFASLSMVSVNVVFCIVYVSLCCLDSVVINTGLKMNNKTTRG